MNYSKLILQLCILFPAFYLSKEYESILLFSITIDSIYSAFYFVNIFVMQDISKKELITNLDELYIIKIMNRYMYYLLLQLIYFIICKILWQEKIVILFYSILITTCPEIMNYIMTKYLSNVIKIIENEKIKFMRYILCKQIANVINTLSILCIDKDPELNYSELLFLLDEYNKVYDNMIIFIKNFLIVSFIHYSKKNTKKVYGNMLTYLYTYQTGNTIEKIDFRTAKRKFVDLVEERAWKKFLNTDILQSIIYMYSQQDNTQVNYIELYLTKFNYMLVKMFTIWTIGTWINTIYLIPLLSSFFLIYKKTIKIIIEQKLMYLFRFGVLMVSFVVKDFFIISFMSEFGYILLVNKVVYTTIVYVYEKTLKITNICLDYNKNNDFLFTLFIYIYVLKGIHYYYYPLNQIHYFVSYSLLILYYRNKYKTFINTLFIILGYISDYDIIHISFILMIFYLGINVYNHYQNNKNVAISILANKLHPSVIDSYYKKVKYISEDEDTSDEEDSELVHISIKAKIPTIVDDDDDFLRGSNSRMLYDSKDY